MEYDFGGLRLESQRLIFREIELTDSDFIVSERSNPEVYQYFVHPHKISLEEHINWFENHYSKDSRRTDYIAFEKDTLARVGVFGIIVSGDLVEINYLISKKYRRKGYASEGIERLLSYSNSELHCKKAFVEIHENNLPSLLLAKNLGFSEVDQSEKILILEKQL